MVSEEKKQVVKQVADLVKEYPLIGVVDMTNLPAPQLQNMRASLRDSVQMIMTRKKLLARGLEAAGKSNVKDLVKCFQGMPALLFTKDNPFKLYKILEKNKSPAPAKAGQTAPKDVVVKAGATSFAPGPIIGELGAVGIKTGVEAGKVAIKADSTVVKAGEVIKPKVAEILKRLNIMPMEIGLNLVAVWENGTIFKGSDLAIDEEKYAADLVTAAQWAMNLAVEAGIANKETIEIMLIKAFRDSKAVALEGNILADAVLGDVLAKVEREIMALKKEAKIETVERPKEAHSVQSHAGEKPAKITEELAEAKKELRGETEHKPVRHEIKHEAKTEAPKVHQEEKHHVHETHKEVKKAEEMPVELSEDTVPSDMVIEKPDLEKAEIEETEEMPAPKNEFNDAPVSLSEEEKEEAEAEAEKKVEEIGSKEPQTSMGELKSRAELIKERINNLKEEKVSPAIKEMVKKTKEFAEKGKVMANDLLKEAKQKEEGPDKGKASSTEELYEKLKKKGTLRDEKSQPTHIPSAYDLMKQKEKQRK